MSESKPSPSFEKVNYLLRLKKQIERKIIIEAFQSISPIIDISEYRYFGLGSIYFADFILFHKYLNIKKMTSTEYNEDDVADPPTDAEIDAIFGTPATVGPGFMGLIDDNDAHTKFWLCVSSGANWLYEELTKAT